MKAPSLQWLATVVGLPSSTEMITTLGHFNPRELCTLRRLQLQWRVRFVQRLQSQNRMATHVFMFTPTPDDDTVKGDFGIIETAQVNNRRANISPIIIHTITSTNDWSSASAAAIRVANTLKAVVLLYDPANVGVTSVALKNFVNNGLGAGEGKIPVVIICGNAAQKYNDVLGDWSTSNFIQVFLYSTTFENARDVLEMITDASNRRGVTRFLKQEEKIAELEKEIAILKHALKTAGLL